MYHLAPMAVSGHLWTVASRLRTPAGAPEPRAWSTVTADPQIGPVTLTGLLREEPDAESLLLFVHGIGGSASARYGFAVARAASQAGLSCLRINLRGCDRRGGDYYHAGLSADLGVALSSPELARYRRVYLLGFSIGGHVTLHGATKGRDPRVRAVAAVCSPLDLARAARTIDSPSRWPYRRYVLRNLVEIYTAVAATRPVPVPPEAAARFTHLRQYDEQIVAPRWGFAGADDYYARAAVAPELKNLDVPALMVAAENDPMVPAEAVRPAAEAAGGKLEVRWVGNGGHVGFPGDLDLGIEAPLGIEGQTIGWLRQAGNEAA